jgi:hypothetical protein
MTCIVDLTGLTKVPGNGSPITEYGKFQDQLIGCRWNILQPMDTCFLNGDQTSRVKLTLGASTHPMRAAVANLIGDSKPRAVRTFLSAPAAIQSRAYYP